MASESVAVCNAQGEIELDNLAVAQFVANLFMNVAQERCMGPPRRAASLLLLAGWLAAALVLTLFGPFVESGNGFFACWVGVAAAVAFAWEERRG